MAIFQHFNGTASVHVCIRNNEAQAHIAKLCTRASLFRRLTDTNVYGTGSVKIWITSHKISVVITYTDIFYSVWLTTPDRAPESTDL